MTVFIIWKRFFSRSDILEIGRGEGESGSFRFKNTGLEVGGYPGKNLVIKAYHLLAADFHLPAIQVHLHKIIPFGAGLGGGSADAAFMLKALNAFFDLRLSGQKMVTYAARLGSDCAFFIDDRPAFASGKGELLEPYVGRLSDHHSETLFRSIYA